MLANTLILISVLLILVAGFLEMTRRKRVFKISKDVFWMSGVYVAVIGVFLQGQGSSSTGGLNLQR